MFGLPVPNVPIVGNPVGEILKPVEGIVGTVVSPVKEVGTGAKNLATSAGKSVENVSKAPSQFLDKAGGAFDSLLSSPMLLIAGVVGIIILSKKGGDK